MSSEERMNIKIKLELHEEITLDDNEEGELMAASFSDGTVKLEDELKKELREELANEIDDNTKYFCELCKSYFPNLSSLQDHMQNHDNCEDNDTKSSKDSKNVDAMKSTDVKEESGEGKHREKPHDKQKEKCNEKKTKRKRQRTEEKDDRINLENDVNENDEYELVNLIMKDHIILRKKHHDVDKASFKIVKEETEDINENDNEELVNLIMKDHIILRTNDHDGNITKMKTEASEETSRNSMCEKSNVNAETSDGNNQIDNELSETRQDTVINVVGDAHDDSNMEKATKCSNNTKRRKKLVSKELATENIPPQSPHMPNQKFDCNICSRSFETSKKLQNHKYRAHRRPSAFCDVCQKKFSSKQVLNEHMKRVHLGIKIEYKCKFCGKGYSYKSNLGYHTNECSKNKNKTHKFKCELCGYKYVDQKTLQNHMADHPKYICGYCDKLCYVKYDLESHIKHIHLKVRYRCKKCGNEYAKLNAHVKRCNKNIPRQSPHIRPNPYSHFSHIKECCKNKTLKFPPQSPHMPNAETSRNSMCEKSNVNAETSDGNNEHMKRVHLRTNETENVPSSNQKFDCNICSRSFETNKKLLHHKYYCHGTPAFCDVCQKHFSNKGNLDLHVKRLHLGIKEECKCMFCGKSYSDISYLRHHTNECSKNKTLKLPPQSPHMPNQFDCNVCSRSFDTSRILQRHKYFSHRPSAFCDVCQKKFSSKQYLDEHMKRVHLGIKMEYKCKFCGKGYSYKSILRRHTNECPKNKTLKFKCELCGYDYVNQKTLQMHMADHPKYICDYCDKLCYARYRLVRHIKKCGKEYANLYEHMKPCNKNIPLQSPHMPNQFDCNVCSRSFDTSKKLQRHKYNSHRPSAFCDVCQKKFSNKGNLERHVKRVHLGVKEECKFLGKGYTDKK